MDLSLRFKDNGTAHRDVELRFGGETWVCDSYYFALDDGLLPEREDAPKVRAVLRRLLEQWTSAIQSLTDDGVVFLPYDFSDQYTAWISCKRAGARLEMRRGWAPVEGWSICPSDVGPLLSSLHGFVEDGPVVQATIDELQAAIRDSMIPLQRRKADAKAPRR